MRFKLSILAIIVSASSVFAGDLLFSGKYYYDAKFGVATTEGVKVEHREGTTLIPYKDLPVDQRTRVDEARQKKSNAAHLSQALIDQQAVAVIGRVVGTGPDGLLVECMQDESTTSASPTALSYFDGASPDEPRQVAAVLLTQRARGTVLLKAHPSFRTVADEDRVAFIGFPYKPEPVHQYAGADGANRTIHVYTIIVAPGRVP